MEVIKLPTGANVYTDLLTGMTVSAVQMEVSIRLDF